MRLTTNQLNNSSADHTKAPIIYLAEDDVDDQELLQEALLELNPDVRLSCFSTGFKFLNQMRLTNAEQLPTLIVLDYNIPEFNGAEILQQLGKDERYGNISKVVWSTSDSKLYRETCLDLGADAYIVKPSTLSGIRDVAERMLRICNAID